MVVGEFEDFRTNLFGKGMDFLSLQVPDRIVLRLSSYKKDFGIR